MNKTTPKARPLMFTGPMVQAILEGRKTQTRRIVKPQPQPSETTVSCILRPNATGTKALFSHVDGRGIHHSSTVVTCPYGMPGDRLYVKETWAPGDDREPPEFVWYRADMTMRNISHVKLDTYAMTEPKWKSAMFMPRLLSRITLEIVNIRVERVQSMTTADAIAEGVEGNGIEYKNYLKPDARYAETPCYSYWTLWDSINGKKEGCDWASNPWCWVIEFKRIKPEVSTHE